jgi:hypothetical protein
MAHICYHSEMRLRKLGVVVALLSMAALGQITAKQVEAHCLDARGGAARFAAVHSLSFVGTIDLGGGKTSTISVWSATAPSRIRIEVDLPQGKLIQGYDGTRAWQISPGAAAPVELTGDAARQVADQAINFVDLIADPEVKLALTGTGKMEGHDYYKLQFTLPTGDAFTQYVDARTWLTFHEDYPGGVEDISDYRKVEGILLPFRYVSGPAGQPGEELDRKQVTLNPELPPDLFERP